ncbi:MAG: V-type ATPase subunit [Candidatus Baldrarchaeia archaeon]
MLREPFSYSFINAWIRAIMSRFVTIGDFERAISATTFEEAFRLIAATTYANVLSDISPEKILTFEEVDTRLSKHFIDTFVRILRLVPKRAEDFLMTYFKKFEFSNLKVVLRAKHARLSREETMKYLLPTSEVEFHLLETYMDTADIESLIEHIPYRAVRKALQDALPSYKELGNTVPLEVALDKLFFSMIWDKIDKLSGIDRKEAMRHIGLEADLQNIMTILRCKALNIDQNVLRQFILPSRYHFGEQIQRRCILATTIEDVLYVLLNTYYKDLISRVKDTYEKYKNITNAERLIEQYKAHEYHRTFIGYPFHIGTILSFFNLKFYETRNVRITLLGKFEGVAPERLRNLLIIF